MKISEKTPCHFISIDRDLHPAAFAHMKALAEELVQKGRRVVMLIDTLSDRGIVPSEERDGILFYNWPARFPGKSRNFPFICRLIQQYRPVSVTANFNAVNQMIFAAWLFRVPERIIWARSLSRMMDCAGTTPAYRQARPSPRKNGCSNWQRAWREFPRPFSMI